MRPITYTLPFPGPVTFIPAGCLHYPIGELDMIRRWVKAVAEAPGGFTILMGDTLDSARTHYRDHVRGYRADQNSQLALDEWHKRDVQALAKELEPIKGKIIGAILGNHYWEYADGTNSEQYLCSLLKIPYLGPLGIVRLEFRDETRTRHHMTLYAHHSGGGQGGRSQSGDVAALQRAESAFDADIYALSHTHRKHGFKEPVMSLNAKGTPRIVERPRAFMRTGAFLKGFGEDMPTTSRAHFPSYAETKALRPTGLGWVELEITLRYSDNKRKAGPRGEPRTMDLRPEMWLRH